jgi:hypothetical protein
MKINILGITKDPNKTGRMSIKINNKQRKYTPDKNIS